MKTKQFMGTLRDGHVLELEQMLKDNKEELFSLKFQVATGHLEDTSRLRAVKKNIARIKTILKEKEMGMSQEATGN